VPADDALEAAAVVALDVHRGVDAEPAGSLPDPPAAGARHTVGVVFLEQTPGAEGTTRSVVAQNAALDEALEGEPVVGGEPGGLVEAHRAVGRLVEDAVEDDLESGMEVCAVCTDGVEAMEAVAQHRPDVLVMDVTMPGAAASRRTSNSARKGW